MARYLLTCSCGQATPVGPAQAGGTLQCSCGQTLNIPTLRGLRELPLADEANTATSDWSDLRGALFVGGVLIVLLGASLGGYFTYAASKIDTVDESTKLEARSIAAIDKLGVDEIYSIWKDVKKVQLEEAETSPHVKAMREFQWKSRAAGVSFAAALLGLLGIIGSLVQGKPSATS